jgi:hypothetical protein
MKRIFTAITIILIAGEVIAAQPENLPSGYVSGNVFRTMSDSVQSGYVEGLMDGYLSASRLAKSDLKITRKLDDCTKGMSEVNIKAILLNYMEDNPVVRGRPMSLIALEALSRACRQIGAPFD